MITLYTVARGSFKVVAQHSSLNRNEIKQLRKIVLILLKGELYITLATSESADIFQASIAFISTVYTAEIDTFRKVSTPEVIMLMHLFW